MAEITPEELRALQQAISNKHILDSCQSGANGFSVERYEPTEYFAKGLIDAFRSNRSAFRYMPFFRSWAELPAVTGSIGSVLGQAVCALGFALFTAWIYGSLVLMFILAPVLLVSSLFSFVFYLLLDFSSETRAAIAVVMAYGFFLFLWTSFIGALIGAPYISAEDIRRLLQQRSETPAT